MGLKKKLKFVNEVVNFVALMQEEQPLEESCRIQRGAILRIFLSMISKIGVGSGTNV